MGKARNCLYPENSLGLGTKGDCGSIRRLAKQLRAGLPVSGSCILEGVLDTMLLEKAEEVRRVLVDNDILAGNMDAESVWGELFAVSLE